MDNPLVSIIIPTFNRAKILSETIDSVIAQTYSNWECLIVDDGSTDDTIEIIQTYLNDSRFQFHQRPANRQKGANACRNYGFELSKGAFINWFDSDDVMATMHLELHLNAHSKEHNDATVTNAAVFYDNPNNLIRGWSVINPVKDMIAETIETKVGWQTGCVLWRRNAIPNKPFLESLASSQEWTFHLEQLINNNTYSLNDSVTCYARDHEERIGKLQSEPKVFSTYYSRRHIIQKLRTKNMINRNKELSLLKYIFTALKMSINSKFYGLTVKIFAYLGRYFWLSQNKSAIIKVMLLATPVYLITGKGERLFKANSNR